MIASEMARKAVRSSNRGWFISLIVLITLLVIVASVSWNAYYNAIVGPFDTPLPSATLPDADKPSPEPPPEP